ncbi:MAG: hypothetical protein KF799_01735 [Bdellovibrionales bacterium]|nr:hypothetical protein [Bdellovibrionales bacterium]
MTLRNQRGQAAIFVALMFNVLFVFFAMAINIALVVHDKINLQNSADMAAYYAAMKQAELMNVIAHENYMIRQSYKLLSWRYRVLGTMGLYRGAPHPVWTGDAAESVYAPAVRPSLCVTYKPTWTEVPEGENLCNTENLVIPALPEVKVIAGFLGLNAGIAALSRQLRAQFDIQCSKHGAYNWWFGMSILHAFRLDQRNRKQIIYGLAQTLSADKNDFLDLDGNSVLEGARETFRKNLTYANLQSFENGGGEFELLNALGGINPQQWLPEIKIIPTIIYTDTLEGASCAASPQPLQNLPQRADSRNLLLQAFPQGLQAGNLVQWRQDSFLADSDFQFSIGVEKNPWYMPYVGIKVKTTPRQIFFPFGNGIEMVARAFAKPFGGRIGPWYSSRWDKGSPTSTGTPTDALMAPRMAAGGLMNSGDDPRRLPNYSRFPGDTLGLSSKLALNGVTGMAQMGIKFDYYKNIKEDMTSSSPNDIMAWDGAGQAPDIRSAEMAALAPDLFDITYYSIEPNFSKNYLPRLIANRTALRIPSDTPIRSDLGSNGQSVPTYSVQEQMAAVKQKGNQRSEAFYFVRDRAHLLTSWLPAPGAFNYDVTQALQNFGKCGLPDDGMKFTNPGSCVAAGGRTGYSVKLVGRDALLSNQHKIGGPPASADAILNPPPAQDGW